YLVDAVVFFELYCSIFFFFSSRRRHTRSKRDWSSDVCSSDLEREPHGPGREASLRVEVDDDAQATGEHADGPGAGVDRGPGDGEIGRASCRERVEIAVGAASGDETRGEG